MPLSDIVAVTISLETAGITQAGFGTPLILSPRPVWIERVRTYSDLTSMVADGFTSFTPEYRAAAAIFSQSPRPESLKVGRCANAPTQRYAVTPVVANSTVYTLTITGPDGVPHDVSYTSDSTATASEINVGLKAGIDALALAVTCSDQTTYMRVVANAAGTFFAIKVASTALLGLAQDHADPGIGADLAAVSLEDPTYYGIVHLYNSKGCIEAVATFAEANAKLFVAQTSDSAVITTAISGTDDIAESLSASAYARTALIYHPDPAAFADAAWLGKCLPFDPGSETWKFKTLAGVSTTYFSGTHLTNLRAKHCNYLYTVAGKNITAEGVVAANEFIDVVRGRDWFQARLQERIFLRLSLAKKIPYTDGGIAVIEGELRAQLSEGIEVGFLTADPAPLVIVPKAASASVGNRAARLLAGVKFNANIAGAIHKLSITGVIAV